MAGRQGSQFEKFGLEQVGDHILQVNGHPVSNMQQLSEEIRRPGPEKGSFAFESS